MFDNVNGFVPHSHPNGQESADSNGIPSSEPANEPTVAHYSPVSGLTGGPAAEPQPQADTLGAGNTGDEPTLVAEPEGVAPVSTDVVAVADVGSFAAGQAPTAAEPEVVFEAVSAVWVEEAVVPDDSGAGSTHAAKSDPALAARAQALADEANEADLAPARSPEAEAPTEIDAVELGAAGSDGPGEAETLTADSAEPSAGGLTAQIDEAELAVVEAEAPDPDPSQPLPVGRPPSPIELDAQVESLLFVADGPAPVGKLAEALEVKVSEVEAALALLEERYLGRGIAIQRIKDRVQLTTAPTAAVLIQRFLGLSATAPLSKAALETLAIIAYRQPITRPQIEQVRGVNSDSVIKNLLTKGLVEEAGIAEGPGRPVLYITTPEFLQHFGLSALTDLPALNLDDVRRSFASEILKG